MTDDTVRLHAVVSGMVQGVSFRYYTRQTARRLGLRGYVRNRGDGTVEVEAEGPRRSVEELFSWLQRGPALADVHSVDASWGKPTGQWASFEVRY
ncbi:MAG: acylphosphatase [Anaerolineae bacterium]